MKFREGDVVSMLGSVTHPDIGGKVYIDIEGYGTVTTDRPSRLTLISRRYRQDDVVERRDGKPPGPHTVLGVHGEYLWTRDAAGAHVVLVDSTVQPYVEPLVAVEAPAPSRMTLDQELVSRGFTLWSAGDPVPKLMNGGIASVRFLDGTIADPNAPGFDWNADRSDNPIIAYIDDLPF